MHPETIRRWWGQWPDANVAIVTGARAGLLVLDVDPDHGGVESLARLEREHGALPETQEAVTGGGGRHILFVHPGGVVQSKVGIAHGLDVRADGGYIVAVPSVHTSGRRYAWDLAHHPDDVKLAAAPRWLLELLASGRNGEATPIPERIPAGQRDATLASLAGSMRRRGASEAALLAALEVENARCDPPLGHDQLEKIARSVGRYPPGRPPDSRPLDGGHEMANRQERDGLRLVAASTVRPESVRWLWRDRIPLGAVTISAGQPGEGKSTSATERAARASRGQLDGDLRGIPTVVVIASAEDHRAAVLVPRLTAAGADLERVFFVDCGEDGFTIPNDLPALAQRAAALGARYALLDPVAAFLTGRVNSWKDHDVRRALAPLAAMAEELDLAVECVSHFTKAQTQDLLAKVGGSVAFTAAARSVLAFAPDPGDPDGPNRVLVHAKSNLGVKAVTLRYRIEGRAVDFEGDQIATSGIAWLGEAPEIGPADLLTRMTGEERTERDEAEEWLVDYLADGPRPAQELFRAGREAGFSKRTLERAKADARVRSRKSGMDGGWAWSLPGSEDRHAALYVSEPGGLGGLRPRPAEIDLAAFEGRQASDIGGLRDFDRVEKGQAQLDEEPVPPDPQVVAALASAYAWPKVTALRVTIGPGEKSWRSYLRRRHDAGELMCIYAALEKLDGQSPTAG